MKFLKYAFLGAVLLLMLPSGGDQRSIIFSNVQQTFADIGAFCTRNPNVCDSVMSAIRGIGEKLGNTANSIETMLYEVGIGADRSHLHQPLADINANTEAPDTEVPETTSSLYVQDTLTDADRVPDWHGPYF